MKKKELKKLAEKIAKCELIIINSQDSAEVKRAQQEAMRLCGCVNSIDDITIIDEMVQEILEKNS